MPALVLLRGLQISRVNYATSRLYHVGRAASVDTAIAKGIRKSNGIALRGKTRPSDNDARPKYMERKGLDSYTPKLTQESAEQKRAKTRQAFETQKDISRSRRERGNVGARIRKGKKDIKPERDSHPFLNRSSFDNLPPRQGDRSSGRRVPGRSNNARYEEGGSRLGDMGDYEGNSRSAKLEGSDGPVVSREHPFFKDGGRGDRNSALSRRPFGETDPANGRGDKPQSSVGRRDYSGTNGKRESTPSEPLRDSFDSKPPDVFFNRRTKQFEPKREDGRYASERSESSRPQVTPEDDSVEGDSIPNLIRRTNKFNARTSGDRDKRLSFRTGESSQPRDNDDGNYKSSGTPLGSNGPVSPYLDRNIPLSIPYTTPASEFLYGSSVVEAALSARRIPRRKLYKLYIYSGENREDPVQDRAMAKLAKEGGIEVVRVAGDWIRLMDKMSGGRPHNGFILEASPLPRLPILSLGEVLTKDGLDGYEVVLDHQSREDAAINGTSTFIRKPYSKSERHPLVLYLDSITDPGNLGGIIRTAAFLGVSAVGISTRNSAPFTPVVLKASAGASENVTIFSVNKPAGFIVDSKAAGWKVYAAVAPAKKKDPHMPAAISTDRLDDPLADDPCILMIGSEGEGLRWNLRSKADSDLFIRGSGQSLNVDSLNVSVATGLLVNAFLRKRGKIAPKTNGETSEIEGSEGEELDAEDAESAEEVPAPKKLGENELF